MALARPFTVRRRWWCAWGLVLGLAGGVSVQTAWAQPAGPTAATAAAAPSCEQPPVLRVAMVPKSAAHSVHTYAPLAQALQQGLGRPVELVPVASYAAVVEGMRAGLIDVAELGPAGYAQLHQHQPQAMPFAALVKTAGKLMRYHALLVVRQDTRWQQLEQLRGASLALVDPVSTSGALLPRQWVQQRTGYPLAQYFRRISYAGSHDRALEAVADGKVDAAFVSSARLDAAREQGLIAPQALRVLWSSPPIVSDPFVWRAGLCGPLQAALRQAFLAPAAALQALWAPFFQQQRMAGFMAVGPADYAGVRELLRSLSAP